MVRGTEARRLSRSERMNLTTRFASLMAPPSVVTRHSHIVTTCHPDERRFLATLRSLALLRMNFSAQNSELLPGTRPFWQWCACQKHPWTKTATFARRKTKSGLPGSSLAFWINLSRVLRSSSSIRRSGPVSFPRILDIRSLRCEGVNESIYLKLLQVRS